MVGPFPGRSGHMVRLADTSQHPSQIQQYMQGDKAGAVCFATLMHEVLEPGAQGHERPYFHSRAILCAKGAVECSLAKAMVKERCWSHRTARPQETQKSFAMTGDKEQ